MSEERIPRFYKRKIDAEGSYVTDPIEISDQQLRREIGCFFADVIKYLERYGTVRVNEYQYWRS